MDLSPSKALAHMSGNCAALLQKKGALVLEQNVVDYDMDTVGDEPRMIIDGQCPKLHGPPIARHDES